MASSEAECGKECVGEQQNEESGAMKDDRMPQGRDCCNEKSEAAAPAGSVDGGSAGSEGAPSDSAKRDLPTQDDLETRLRIAESELVLRREQEEALRKRLGDAALWAAEAARQLGAERRRGEVRCATAAAFEAQHRAALKAAEELRVRLDAALAERDAAARAALLLKDEIADLKQQLLMQGQHLNCQLDLENAAVKYQGKIKEYLLLICRNLKQLEEEQEMLKQSVSNVSNISEKMEKGINHYSCKEKLWTSEKLTLEKKVIELRAEVERLSIKSEKTHAERTKYYEGVVADLQHNLNFEKEKNTRLVKNIEEIKSTGMNYEHKIEELIHQVHEKKEHIDLLEKEKADLHNMLKHNEREMEIRERKHKYELDYARQKPLAFSCETQTDSITKDQIESSNGQNNHSDCTLCFTKSQCVYKQKRRLNRPNTPYYNHPGQPSIISIPSSQNNEGCDSVPFIYKYNESIYPSTISATNLYHTVKTEPISLDSLGPVDDNYDSQWYTRRYHGTNNVNNTDQSSTSKSIISIDISNEGCSEVSKDINDTSNEEICEGKRSSTANNLESPIKSVPVSPANNVRNKIPIVNLQTNLIESISSEASEVERDTIISNSCPHSHNVENIICDGNNTRNKRDNVDNLSASVQQATGSLKDSDNDNKVLQNETKLKRRIFKVLH